MGKNIRDINVILETCKGNIYYFLQFLNPGIVKFWENQGHLFWFMDPMPASSEVKRIIFCVGGKDNVMPLNLIFQNNLNSSLEDFEYIFHNKVLSEKEMLRIMNMWSFS